MFANQQSATFTFRGKGLRGLPPRLERQQSTNHNRSDTANHPDLSEVQPSDDYDSAREISTASNELPPGLTAQQTSQRYECFDPAYSMRTSSVQHMRPSQTPISPLEPPSSEDVMGCYPLGCCNSAVNAYSSGSGVINSGTGHARSFASQPLSRPSSQQLPQEHSNTAFYQPQVAPSNNARYTGRSADSRYDFPNSDPQHAGDSVSRRTSRNQSIDSQIGHEGYEVTNRSIFQISHSQPASTLSRVRSEPIRTITNHPTPSRHRSVDKHPSMQLDPDLQKRTSVLRVSEDEDNASYITGMNHMWNDVSSVASSSTTHSESRNSVESAYSSPVSDEEESPSWQSYPQQANSPNGSAFSTGVDLRRAHNRYKEQNRSDDVGFDFSPFLSTELICDSGESFLMRGRCLARSPAEVV
jgi:hypothetical protein